MADTVAIAYPIPPTGTAENNIMRVNFDAVVTAINNISNGLTNFNQLNVGTASASDGVINWYNSSNGFYYQIKPTTAPTANRIYSFDDIGVDGNFVLTAGAQSIAGSKTFTGNLAFSYTLNNAANLFQILNNSTGASAGAGIQIQVNGTGTNDPFIWFGNTSTNWAIGIDNSDAAKFKISQNLALGTNDWLTITTAGVITFGGTVTTPTFSGALAVGSGGTGQTTYTDGQLLIGNTTGNTLAKAALTGTASQITVTNGHGTITLATPQNIDSTATPTFASATLTAVSNQLVLGTTRTITVTAPTPATSSRVYTIPDAGKDTGFVTTDDTATIIGKTFSSALTVTPTTNQIVLGVTRTVTLSATQPAVSSRTWTVPDITGNGTFAALEGTQTFSGSKTFSSAVDITTISHTGGVAIQGTNTSSGPSSGNYGEVISSAITSPANFGATGVYGDLTSISLTAGHWIVYVALFPGNNAGTTFTQIDFGVSTTTGNSTTGLTQGDTAGFVTATAVPTGGFLVTEVKISSTTIHYLKYEAQYSGSTPSARGKITAVRVS